jgi:anti-anti-sigma regulatory factor
MATIPLPAVLDTPAAGELRTTLRQSIRGGQPLSLDGAGVERVGLACLQVLVAGKAAAARAGVNLSIVHPSQSLTDMATMAGLGTLLAD